MTADTLSYERETPRRSFFIGPSERPRWCLLAGRTHIDHDIEPRERFDAALIRAGRVDMKLELGLTNRDINARLFSSMFLRENAPDEGKGAEQRIQLEKLATDIVAMGLVAKTMTLLE